MSRVGKNPVSIPSGVTVNLTSSNIEVSGKLGKLSLALTDHVTVENVDNQIVVKPASESKMSRMMWGTTARRVKNMLNDVTNGVTVNLDLVGVGYRASVQGSTLTVQLGFSHDIVYPLPAGITVKCDKPTIIAVTGADRQMVGQVAAEIRNYRRPEPYKGKGVIRQGEFVVRKEGKKK